MEREVAKDHQHWKTLKLKCMVAKSCSRLSGMLKVWCNQNSRLVAKSLTVGGSRKHWQSCKDNSKSLSSHGVASCSVWQCSTMHKCKNYCRDWNLGFTVLYHPPHSPNVAMSDFHLFPKPKEHFRACHHMLDDETKTLLKLYSSIIKMHNSNMRDLQSTWTVKKCVNHEGDYVEK